MLPLEEKKGNKTLLVVVRITIFIFNCTELCEYK